MLFYNFRILYQKLDLKHTGTEEYAPVPVFITYYNIMQIRPPLPSFMIR